MTKEFFEQQMKIIFADFGKDEYTPNRIALIWDSCKDLPDKSFAWVVKHFQRSRSIKYPPLPDHFIEAALEQKKLINDGWRRPQESYDLPTPAGDALENVLKKAGASNAFEAARKLKIVKPGEGA